MNVKELRQTLEKLPDDAIILVTSPDLGFDEGSAVEYVKEFHAHLDADLQRYRDEYDTDYPEDQQYLKDQIDLVNGHKVKVPKGAIVFMRIGSHPDDVVTAEYAWNYELEQGKREQASERRFEERAGVYGPQEDWSGMHEDFEDAPFGPEVDEFDFDDLDWRDYDEY